MKHIIVIAFASLYINLHAQFNPQTKTITETFFPDSEEVLNTTPALQKKKGFTNYNELVAFLNKMENEHSNIVKLDSIGVSQKGKIIPLLRISIPNKEDKIKVWIQAGIHGDEPASTEATLYLIERLLNDPSHKDLINHIDLAIVPMANIDGYLKNNRYAANSLDLNRDQTKLMSPENQALKRAFSIFNPHVALDFHEYRPYRRDFVNLSDFGVTNKFDVMFLNSSNLNIPENLRELTKTLFVDNAAKSLDTFNYKHHPYISTVKTKGEIRINQGSISSRSFATNTALTNTISSLIEVRGVGLKKTSFKRRVHSGFLVALSYIKTAQEHRTLIKKEIEKAITQKNDIVVTSERGIYNNNISFIDLNTNKYVDVSLTIQDAAKSTPNLVRKRPLAYIIESNQDNLINKLTLHGIEVTYLEQETNLTVEAYQIKDYSVAAFKYEQMKLQSVNVEIKESSLKFPKGTAIVYMNQQRANLAAEILEPEAPNSFVSFGVLKAKQGDILPIYRLLN